MNLEEVAERLKRGTENLKQSRRRVLDLCKRGELPFKPDGRYNKRIKESDLEAYLHKGYGFHRRPVRKRPVDPAKELAKAESQLVKLQAKIETLKQ